MDCFACAGLNGGVCSSCWAERRCLDHMKPHIVRQARRRALCMTVELQGLGMMAGRSFRSVLRSMRVEVARAWGYWRVRPVCGAV